MRRTYSIYMDELYMLGVIVFGGGALLDRTKAETIEKSQGFFDTLTQLVKELWSAA